MFSGYPSRVTSQGAEIELERSAIEQRREWQTLLRVLESSTFVRSNKLKSFLIYVSERALSGRTDEITEQQIGVAVFGRRADYSPGEDSIVRSQARLLRAKLEAFFEDEGRDEPLRITIPKGTYIPVFEVRLASVTEVIAVEPKSAFLDPDRFAHSARPKFSLAPRATWTPERWCLVFSLGLLMMLGALEVRRHWKATEYQRASDTSVLVKCLRPRSPDFDRDDRFRACHAG